MILVKKRILSIFAKTYKLTVISKVFSLEDAKDTFFNPYLSKTFCSEVNFIQNCNL